MFVLGVPAPFYKNYNDISSLEEAVHGLSLNYQYTPPLSDFDTITLKTGIYQCSINENTLNKPFPELIGGVVYLLFVLNSDYAYLILTDSGKFCIRKHWSSGWVNWMVLS